MQGLDLPRRLFGTRSDDYELYEADGEFGLAIGVPDFECDEIEVQ